MRLTKYSAHNAFHHCDQCQHYKDVTATEVLLYATSLDENISSKYIISRSIVKDIVLENWLSLLDTIQEM